MQIMKKPDDIQRGPVHVYHLIHTFFCLHLYFAFIVSPIVVFVAAIQARVILYLLTFSVFLQSGATAQPNQGLLWGGVGYSYLPVDIWWKGVKWKSHLTPWGRGLTPKLISDTLCLCVKRSLCLSGKRNSFQGELKAGHPLSLSCVKCAGSLLWRTSLGNLFFLINKVQIRCFFCLLAHCRGWIMDVITCW